MNSIKTGIINNRLTIGIICIMTFLIIIPGIFIGIQTDNVPDNPIDGLNYRKSEVLITGTGYKIDKGQDKVHKENKKKFEKLKEEESKERNNSKNPEHINKKGESQSDPASENGTGKDGGSPENGGNLGEDKHENNSDGNTKNDHEESNLPVIETNLENGKTYNGTFLTVEVTAKDYRGRYISAYNLVIIANDAKLTSFNDNGKKVLYNLDLLDGVNTVSVKAIDSYGNSRTKEYSIYGNTKAAQEKFGTAVFSVEAGVLGLPDLIAPTKIELYKGEQLSYIIDRMLTEKGYEYSNTGSLKNGFYLSRIYRPGLTEGFRIPDELLRRLKESGEEDKPHEKDSLGEKDFMRYSGWWYQVNSTYLNSGISHYVPSDGDVIRIRFSLGMGRDIGAHQGGEVWGDW